MFEEKILVRSDGAEEVCIELMAKENQTLRFYDVDTGSDDIRFFLDNVLCPKLDESTCCSSVVAHVVNAHFRNLFEGKDAENFSLRGIRVFEDRIEVCFVKHRRSRSGVLLSDSRLMTQNIFFAEMPKDSSFSLGVQILETCSGKDTLVDHGLILFLPEEMNLINCTGNEETFYLERVAA